MAGRAVRVLDASGTSQQQNTAGQFVKHLVQQRKRLACAAKLPKFICPENSSFGASLSVDKGVKNIRISFKTLFARISWVVRNRVTLQTVTSVSILNLVRHMKT